MSYSLFIAEKAQKKLTKLPIKHAIRIIEKLETIKDSPHRYAEGCEGYPYYHLRVGNYRIILDIDEKEQIIKILKIGLRKTVYER